MAYLVLAVGAIMALLGALAILTGYPIIQIERGWTTVIAGSTLLAGGIVTMALGLALRAINGLHAALLNAALAAPSSTIYVPGAEPREEAEPTFGIGHRQEPTEATTSYDAAALGATAIALPAVALAMAARHEPEAELHPAHEQSPPAALHAPAESDHHPETPAHEPPPTPPIDDWLDKAFADLSLDAPRAKDIDHGPSTQAEPEPLHAETMVAHHDGDVLYADDRVTALQVETVHPAHVAEAPDLVDAHEPVHLEADHEAPHDLGEPAHAEPAQHEPSGAVADGPAVIGRYEADGTAYTMYADGSIEAQSDAGVYRFASMADLKAFIEG